MSNSVYKSTITAKKHGKENIWETERKCEKGKESQREKEREREKEDESGNCIDNTHLHEK